MTITSHYYNRTVTHVSSDIDTIKYHSLIKPHLHDRYVTIKTQLYVAAVFMINVNNNNNNCIIDAITVVPSSITACPGQTVLTFNCTANVDIVRWNMFTPVRNYTNLLWWMVM